MVPSEVDKNVVKLIDRRNLERKQRTASYYDQLREQAKTRAAQRKLEKQADRQLANESLGLNYECYRRDEFIAQQRSELKPFLKDQMLEKTLKKADEKHQEVREKIVQDEGIRQSDAFAREIKSAHPAARRVATEPADDKNLELATRDGLAAQQKQKLMQSLLLKQMMESRKKAQ